MLLTALTFLPLLAALFVFFMPSDKTAKWFTLGFTVFIFLLSLSLFNVFDPNSAQLQLVEKVSWIPALGVDYFLAIDGISFWLVLLTTLLTPIALVGAWTSVEHKQKAFCICLLALETTMLGTFLSMNAVLFYCFFEASLIPMYFMIGIWGGARRLYATIKFFIYTMAGSIFMLLGIVALIFITATLPGGQISANITDFYKLDLPFVAGEFFNTQTLLFFAFALAFAIKVPMFPFHTWLPDAHVEAPTPGSVILAGVLLKMGTYGFLRFAIPIFPEAAEHWAWIFLLVGVVGIVYGALVAMVQPDMKKLVAYSSVSHMGYVMIGMFALNHQGVVGALYQMLNHGISTGALFMLVGMIYERTHTREIKEYGGLASAAPIFTVMFIVVTMSSIAVPMTNGFVGEYLILMGTFLANKWYAAVAVLGVVLGAAYMLWMVKRIFFGEEHGVVVQHKAHGLDLNLREVLVMIPLLVLIFWMGLFPNQFFKWSDASVAHLVNSKGQYQLTIKEPAQRNVSVSLKDKNP
jgi:NADH-quinone oxidoreductase subunit M